jgi:hypothetical protein
MESKVTEHEKELIRLWEEGLTGKEIADRIGTTRNAVMGKLHRLRERHVISYKSVATRLAAIRHAVKVRERAKERATEAGVPPKPVEEKPLIEAVEELLPLIIEELKPQYADRQPVGFMDLGPSSCRYVVGGVMAKDFLFCNEVKKIGSSYCEEHHARCNVPNTIIRRKVIKNDVTA